MQVLVGSGLGHCLVFGIIIFTFICCCYFSYFFFLRSVYPFILLLLFLFKAVSMTYIEMTNTNLLQILTFMFTTLIT